MSWSTSSPIVSCPSPGRYSVPPGPLLTPVTCLFLPLSPPARSVLEWHHDQSPLFSFFLFHLFALRNALCLWRYSLATHRPQEWPSLTSTPWTARARISSSVPSVWSPPDLSLLVTRRIECAHTRTHTYKHIHTHTHTHTHTRTHIHTHIYKHTHTHTYTYIHIHTHIRKPRRHHELGRLAGHCFVPGPQPYISKHTSSYTTDTYIRTQRCTHTHAYIRIFTRIDT
jgi:hypothetical protein